MLCTKQGARTPWKTSAALLIAAGLIAGCASSGSSDQKQSSKLGTTMEQYGAQAKTAIMDLKATLEAHDTLVNEPTGDMVATYDVFAKGVKKSAKSYDALVKTGTKLGELAEGRFGEWETRIASFSSESMAERSQNQLGTTREKFEAVTTAGEEMMAAYKPLLTLLQDHSLYMSTDLNATSTAALAEDNEDIEDMREKLGESIDELSAAAEDFVALTAMSIPVEEPAETK